MLRQKNAGHGLIRQTKPGAAHFGRRPPRRCQVGKEQIFQNFLFSAASFRNDDRDDNLH
jgi:hypothetical protein